MDQETMFQGTACTLEQVLHSRSDRQDRQQALLKRGCSCLISFGLNVPGAVKQSPALRQVFDEGLSQLRQLLPGALGEESVRHLVTGSEALLAVRLPAGVVKQKTVMLEELHPLGRLFDMDVLDSSGRSLSRKDFGLPARRCLLCGGDAKVCGRSRAHDAAALRHRLADICGSFFRDKWAQTYSDCAVRALLHEVSATPKPGLVDRQNSGSHSDMDFSTFVDSSVSLAGSFQEMFRIGWDGADLPRSMLFDRLRFAGQKAEGAMLRATGGVNTHKGLIFSMGILCGALGAATADGEQIPTRDRVLDISRELGRCALADFQGEESISDTSGLRCYRQYQITGARGVAAGGFQSVLTIGLPALHRWTEQGLALSDAAALTLLALIAGTEDTNMIHRGGLARARQRRVEAGELYCRATPENFRTLLNDLDRQYIRENLSPGGCADLLALSLMLFFLEQEGLLA